MYDSQHTFTKTLVKFNDLVLKYYHGDIEFELGLNGEFTAEKDHVADLNQRLTIAYTVVTPAQMASFTPPTPLMNMPFLVTLTSGTN